ncbi:MAG: CPBP family intramembrane metalloprotease [Nitrospirae bacterium]|nr:CPBP family intramembrane metalloprotease [Nitrospirota bacterium]
MSVTKASNPDARLAEFLLAAVLVIVVALAEETVFRGYLILRFKNVMANTSAAVLLSAVIFSLGHGYEGSDGVITVGSWVWSLVSSIYGGRASSLPW